MEGSLADELYSETLQLSRVKLDHGSTTNLKQDELCGIDFSLNYWFPKLDYEFIQKPLVGFPMEYCNF